MLVTPRDPLIHTLTIPVSVAVSPLSASPGAVDAASRPWFPRLLLIPSIFDIS